MSFDADAVRIPQGSVLAAYPDLRDPNFMHSVILMGEHTDEGAFGLVLNRRTDYTIDDLFPEHETLRRSRLPIHLGGPVDQGRFQFIHTVPDEIQGGLSLDSKLYIGGDLNQLAHYLDRLGDAAQRRVRAFLGYSGWAAGQLEAELSTNSWIPSAPEGGGLVPELLAECVEEQPEVMWRRVVRSASGAEPGLENLPPDASWN